MSEAHRGERVKASLAVTWLGVLSCLAWLAEVVFLKGWDGLGWLDGYPKAALVGILCVVLSVAFSTRGAWRNASPSRRAFFLIAAVAVSLASFVLARACLYSLHSRSAALMGLAGERGMASSFILSNLAGLVGSALFAAVGMGLTVRVLVRVRWWLAGAYLLAIVLAIPAGLLTIRALPALNGATDYLHVIKMGYPLFWLNVFMGLATWIGSRAEPY